MNQSPKIKILVAHHKPGYVFENDMFLPIQVGKAISNVDLGIQGDDTGDNISNLNPYYCELTAIYWAWKNLNADYYGLNHYRRYFTDVMPYVDIRELKERILTTLFRKNKSLVWRNLTIKSSQLIDKHLAEVSRTFSVYVKEKALIIVPNKCFYLNMTTEDHFSGALGKRHIESLKNIIRNDHSDYIQVFDHSLRDKFLYPANIFLFEKEIFEEYCTLIFSVLRKHMNYEVALKGSLDDYSRISGYMGELLTNMFIKSQIGHGISVQENPIMYLK